MTTPIHLVAEHGHVLAKAAASPASSNFITALVAIALIVGAWYAKKHKGWDVPQMIYGFLVAVAISATQWGAPMITAAGSALNALGDAATSFLS